MVVQMLLLEVQEVEEHIIVRMHLEEEIKEDILRQKEMMVVQDPMVLFSLVVEEEVLEL